MMIILQLIECDILLNMHIKNNLYAMQFHREGINIVLRFVKLIFCEWKIVVVD